MTMVTPAAGWAGLLLGLAGSVVLAVFGSLRRPDSVRRAQLCAACSVARCLPWPRSRKPC